MSMTQGIVDELRAVSEELAAEARKARHKDRKEKLYRWAILLSDCADDLGDD